MQKIKTRKESSEERQRKKGYLVGMVVTDRSGVFYVAIVLRFQIVFLHC